MANSPRHCLLSRFRSVARHYLSRRGLSFANPYEAIAAAASLEFFASASIARGRSKRVALKLQLNEQFYLFCATEIQRNEQSIRRSAAASRLRVIARILPLRLAEEGGFAMAEERRMR